MNEDPQVHIYAQEERKNWIGGQKQWRRNVKPYKKKSKT